MAKTKSTKTNPTVAPAPAAATAEAPTEAKPEKTKEAKPPKPEINYTFGDSEYNGRKVFTSKGRGVVAGEDKEHERVLVTINGKDHHFPIASIRFKAVDDKYRENYLVDRAVKTESGAPSISCGDDVAEAVKGLSLDQMKEVAKENDVAVEGWSHLNKGMQSMNIRNAVRKKWKADPKSVTILGKSVAEAQKARMADAEAARKVAAEKKAERDAANKAKAEERAKVAAEKAAKAAEAKTKDGDAKSSGKKAA